MTLPKIYCFVNGGRGTDWQIVMAIAEDGNCLAGHVSSHKQWAKHDIGLTSDWNHDKYAEHYPDGYELEWIDNPKIGQHAGLDLAYERNQSFAEAENPGTWNDLFDLS